MIQTQLQAARVVLQVQGGTSLTLALGQMKFWATDRSWGALQDICFGVFRHLGLLRGVLAALADKPVTDRDLEALLLVALYQLEFTRAAPYAVVDHAVQACARLRKASAKGLVNALLRNFLRRREALALLARRTEEGRWSHQQWWIDELRRAYPDHYGSILAAGNARPPMTLRVNLRRISREDYLALLRACGFDAEPLGPAALLLGEAMRVEELPGFEQGLVSVQDLSAQYAAELLDLEVGQHVLDACAAPGGKTAHILERAGVDLTAVDRDATRLTRVHETLQRLALPAQRVLCADAADPSTWWNGVPFQRILLDAPCTASGIVRRHPDIKWLRRAQDITGLVAQQCRLLEALWRTLAAGGKLLYATCSVFPAE
ncbi:MAG TPA: 16S rRNA (cytosine(967)-C(5))-methyltransferase RsmB, partial [Burkholderiales bacterium]|nr:16S rRNA (cytosine(967)-C(5))-methyltransferase RsmB [Burkholderiales bacterium]